MQAQQMRRALPAPNIVFYHVVMPLLRLYLFLRYGYRRPKDIPAIPADAPYVVLGNHASNLDFLFTFTALYPHRMNALVSSYFFGQRGLSLLLRFLRCIPRRQFTADPASIRAMLGVLKRNGGVLLYPEGEVNGTGRLYSMPPGIGRLCRMMGASVYAAVTSGSYMTKPKWANGERKGRVECRISLIASAEELKELSPKALDERIKKALFYDDHAWQKRSRVPFKGGDCAEGLERMCYLCPRCGAEGRMRTHADVITCTACGNGMRMDTYGLLHPARKGDTAFESVADWVQSERDALKKELLPPDFCMASKGSILTHPRADKLDYSKAGDGVLRMDHDAIMYEGMKQGKQVSLRWALKDFYKTPFKAGAHMEIPGDEGERVALVPENPQMLEKYVLAVELLHEMREAETPTKA